MKINNHKLKIAVIGCGRVANSHLDALKILNKYYDLLAVVDIEEERAKKYAELYETDYYTSLKEVNENSKIEAVIICLPHFLHKSITVECLNSNKHVLVEKPMALNSKEAKEMVKIAKKTQKILMVGQSRRFFDAIRILKEKIDEIAKPFSTYIFWGHWVDFSNRSEWSKSIKKTGGLVLPLNGSHAVDHAVWLYGRKPISVYAKLFKHREVNGFSEATIILEFSKNEVATIQLSFSTIPPKHLIVINGPFGSFQINHADEPQKVGVGSLELQYNGETIIKGKQEPSNFVNQLKEFYSAIKEEREPIASGAEILHVMQVLDSIKESNSSKKKIEL